MQLARIPYEAFRSASCSVKAIIEAGRRREGNQAEAQQGGRNASQPFCPGFWDGTMTTTATTIRLPRLGRRPEECDTMELPQTGGCQCGGVRHEITQAPVMVSYTCHCTDCQRMTSSAFSLGCVLPDGAFRLVHGEPKGLQRTTGSGRVSTRWVCPECGVWVCTAPRPGVTVRNMRGGTLDDTW
jgi:hypothetical protein